MAEPPDLPQQDPDIEATAREYIDYTEYLPSDILRYLQRLKSLETTHLTSYDQLNVELQEFSKLDSARSRANVATATVNTLGAPLDAHNLLSTVSDKEQELRCRISKFLNTTVQARKETAEEAKRFQENVFRHNSRLQAISGKLDEVHLPSRDPTPPTQVPKITLRLPAAATADATSPSRKQPKDLNRRSVPRPPPQIPHLPGQGSGDEGSGMDTDVDNEGGWDDVHDTPSAPKNRKKGSSDKKQRAPKAPPLDPLLCGGASSTNPDGTPIPPRLLPWNQLTKEELAKLRKRMKKNAGWTPSVTMIVRELELLGRGPNNMDAFREQWEGKDWVIVDPEEGGIGDPTKILPDIEGRENKGMRLNQAKKRKREEEKAERYREAERQGLDPEEEERKIEAAEQDRQRQLAQQKRKKKREEEEAARLRDIREKSEREALERAEQERAILEQKLREADEARIKAETEAAEAKKLAEEERKERERLEKEKAEMEVAAAERERIAAEQQQRLLEAPSSAKRAKEEPVNSDDDDELSDVPSELPDLRATSRRATSKSSPAATNKAQPAPGPTPRPKRASTKEQTPAPVTTPPPPATIRKSSVAAPSTTGTTQEPATIKKPPKTAAATAARKAAAANRARSKGPNGRVRKTKNTVTTSSDATVAGAADGNGTAGEPVLGEEEEEDLNKYCLCDEVSQGMMVACENEDCPKIWFHISCVGLTKEDAERDDKWYCPICADNNGTKRASKRRKKTTG